MYNGDSSTMYQLGFNRGRSGNKTRRSTLLVSTNLNYAKGIQDGYKQYQRDKLEHLVLGEEHNDNTDYK